MRILNVAVLALVLGASALAAQPINFTAYHSPAQVNHEINRFPMRFPSLARVVTLGNSVEGRPIRAIRISNNPAVDIPSKGDVLFVALHHAREWVSTEFALYLAEQILMRYSTDPQVKADVDRLQIWIVPVVNPDGFAWTWSDPGRRYWRKNRRSNGDGTFGVDLNRNWGYEWGLTPGSSGTTVHDTYRGPAPFSEPETQVLRAFIDSRPNLKAFLTYHTYGEMFLSPWSYTNAAPPGASTLTSLYERSRDVIAAVHGHVYAPSIWYISSGEATDYLWGEQRIAAFTPELRPSTAEGSGMSGLAGFSPPASIIIPTAQENLPAALAIIHDAAAREAWIRDHSSDTGVEPSAVWTGSGWSHAFWTSPDIWTVPAELTEGTTVTLHVRVQNGTTAPITGVRVDAYSTDPRVTLEFPSPTSTLIGSQTITVPVGGTTISMPWTVPTGTNSWGERHWCVGVVLRHSRDLPLTTHAQRSNNIAIRNFSTVAATGLFTRTVAATNFLDTDAEFQVVVDALPPGWTVRVPDVRQLQPREEISLTHVRAQLRDPETLARKGRLLDATGLLLRPGETVLIPVTVVPPPNAPPGTAADVNLQGVLLPLVAGKREPQGNGYTFRVIAGPAPHFEPRRR